MTTLHGGVTVTRASLGSPVPLKFRDDIFVHDRIATGPHAAARILLGGRAVITIRERSVVTITELPGVSTVDLAQGRAAVAVAREKMQAGDLVEVRTPNAVAGIRGTVIVAEVWDSSRSTITVLKGVIDVARLENGARVGSPVVLNAFQRVALNGAAATPTPQTITPETARRLGEDFRIAPPNAPPAASAAPVNEAEIKRTVESLLTESRSAAPAVAPRREDEDASRNVSGVDGSAPAAASSAPAQSNASAAASSAPPQSSPPTAAAGNSSSGASAAPPGRPSANPGPVGVTSSAVATTAPSPVTSSPPMAPATPPTVSPAAVAAPSVANVTKVPAPVVGSGPLPGVQAAPSLKNQARIENLERVIERALSKIERRQGRGKDD